MPLLRHSSNAQPLVCKRRGVVRNSWGTNLGKNRYFKMERNVADTLTGKCGNAMQPSYPTKNAQNQTKSNRDEARPGQLISSTYKGKERYTNILSVRFI